MDSILNRPYLFWPIFSILLLTVPIISATGNVIATSLDRGIDLVGVSMSRDRQTLMMAGNMERRLILDGGLWVEGPVSMVRVMKGAKNQTFLLNSISSVKLTGISESLVNGDEHVMVVGEYEDKVSMCGGSKVLEAEQSSVGGISAFLASFKIPSHSEGFNMNLCPTYTRDIRIIGGSGGGNCKIQNLKVLSLQPSTPTLRDTPSAVNFVSLRTSGCKSNEEIEDSQNGFGILSIPKTPINDPINPKFLFTSDAIEWNIEVMEAEDSENQFKWTISPPNERSISSLPPNDDSYDDYHRIWVGGYARPLSSECENSEPSKVCRFSPNGSPNLKMDINKKGVWFALILVDKGSGRLYLKQMFFFPEHSKAIGLTFHKFEYEEPIGNNNNKKVNNRPTPNTVTFLTQKSSDIWVSSIFSPITISSNSSGSQTDSSQPDTIEPKCPVSQILNTEDASSPSPFPHPPPTSDTIIHISSFKANSRTISPSNSSPNLPSETNGMGIVITKQTEGDSNKFISIISQITPIIQSFEESFEDGEPTIQFVSHSIGSISSEGISTNSGGGIRIRKTFVVGTSSNDDPNQSIFSSSLLSSSSFPVELSFISTSNISYPKTIGGSPVPSVPVAVPVPVEAPPPKEINPHSPPPPPPTMPNPNPIPLSSSPLPQDESPTPLYQSSLSSATKWAIVVLSFLLLSTIAYFSIRYYLNQRIIALQSSHHRRLGGGEGGGLMDDHDGNDGNDRHNRHGRNGSDQENQITLRSFSSNVELDP